MAFYQEQEHQQVPHFLVDSLFCEEEKWIEEEEEEKSLDDDESIYNTNAKTPSLPPLLLLEQDLFWEDEELISLFTREKDTHLAISGLDLDSDPSLIIARRGAVEWMLRVNAHYAFSPLSAVLSVNYLDRFLSSFKFQKDKPWMIQLAAVACLSLAAKVEETQVPLLLDLQVEDTKYMFESKTIMRMELLVLSTLQWKMSPVTPMSFLDHITRRLGLKNHLHWEFFRRCEGLLLSMVADSRFVRFLPSVLATSTMLYVIDQVEPCDSVQYQNQLMGILKISKDKVKDCYELILESTLGFNRQGYGNKRKFQSIPSSPNGVVDVSFSCENSNDSWVISSPEPLFKKSRAQDQQMRLPSINRVFVDVLNAPR